MIDNALDRSDARPDKLYPTYLQRVQFILKYYNDEPCSTMLITNETKLIVLYVT